MLLRLSPCEQRPCLCHGDVTGMGQGCHQDVPQGAAALAARPLWTFAALHPGSHGTAPSTQTPFILLHTACVLNQKRLPPLQLLPPELSRPWLLQLPLPSQLCFCPITFSLQVLIILTPAGLSHRAWPWTSCLPLLWCP